MDFFYISNPNAAAVYARINGVLTTIAAPGTVLPGGGVIEYCSAAAISGDRVAFVGYTATDRGIFVWDHGQIQTVIRSGGQLGGINASVFDLSAEAFDGNTLAFVFYDGTGNLGGIYTATIPAPSAVCVLAALPMAFRRRRAGTV